MRILYLSLVIVVLDQVTKLSVKGFRIPFLDVHYEGMLLGERIPVIGDFFRITFVENPGMAFGIGLGVEMKFLVSLFSIIASIGLVYYLYQQRAGQFSLRLGIALILGGAIGNLIDRLFYGVFYNYGSLFYGKVVDFLDFDFFDFEIFGRVYDRWPVFNIADAAVTIGVFVLIVFYRHIDEEKKSETTTDEDVEPFEQNNESLPGKDEEAEPSEEVIEEAVKPEKEIVQKEKEDDGENNNRKDI